MQFQVLGPLTVAREDQMIDIGGPRQQVVLAMLLFSSPLVISVESLVDAVWPDDPPATAREQVQICISHLRQRLDHRRGPASITTRTPGYALDLGGAVLDLHRFTAEVQVGRTAAAAGRLEEAASALGEALDLWHGPVALAGIGSRSVRDIATRLEDQRAAALEDYIDVTLRRGMHTDAINLLVAEVDHSPLRDRLRAQLMLALFRAGRKSDALREFRRARRISVNELGLEPAEELVRLERAILRDDLGLRSLAPSGGPEPETGETAVPRLLPAPIADFTGRAASIAAVQAAMTDNAAPGSVPIAVVSGPGGIGKTVLAVHVAHRLAAAYPDGQLFATMHGSSFPVRVATVLERFLRVLGVPGPLIPDGLENRADLYRDRLAGRQVLVVLDDIASVPQVQALLPPGGCGVLVTSRRRITALPGAERIELPTFRPRSALQMLESIVGRPRTEAEPEEAAELVRLCGHLPLAVRIAGSRLAARPHWSIAEMNERIGEAGLLDELQHEGLGVRASIRLSYESLGAPARALLRRLSLIEAPDFGAWVCSALLDLSPRVAQDLLSELIELHLVEVDTATDPVATRYRLHDLVRLVARECAETEDRTDEQTEATQRFLGAFLYLLEAAHRQEYGGDYLVVRSDAARHPVDARLMNRLLSDPLRWLSAERRALSAAVEQAAVGGRPELCWAIAVGGVTLFEAHAHYDDWRETHRIALTAARRGGDRLGEAVTLYSIGSLHAFERQYDEAERYLGEALGMLVELECGQGIAMAGRNLAFIDRISGRHKLARDRLESALGVFRDTGDRVGEAHVLSGLAQLEMEDHRHESALTLLQQAAVICARVRNRRVGAQVMHRLGDLYLAVGRLDEAQAQFEQVLEFARVSGDPVAHVFALAGTGEVAISRGEVAPARELLERAKDLAGELGENHVRARVLLALEGLAARDVDRAGRVHSADRPGRDGGAQAVRSALERPVRSIGQAEPTD